MRQPRTGLYAYYIMYWHIGDASNCKIILSKGTPTR